MRVGSAVAAIGEARSRLGLGPEAAGPEARAAMREVEERLQSVETALGNFQSIPTELVG